MTPDSALQRPCLLLVDDTPSNIDILVGLLRDDYELKIANRGAKALRICEEGERIDLILLDVMMPEMDGYEVCRSLRSKPATQETPVIFLTSKTEQDDIVKGFEAGANDYVPKPFRPQELRARVRTHLMLRSQQREIELKNRELKELLHLVCHDVANQFSVLSMTMELLQLHPEAELGNFMPRMAAAVRNGVGLTRLVRDLRRVEDKGVHLEAVAVRPVLEECLLLAEDRLKAKGLSVQLDLPSVCVSGEPCTLTNSVFGNILSNAIKFSPHGARISISGTQGDGFLCVSIRDQGIGMPPKILDCLFDVGRSHSRYGTDGEKGTGFGMTLMRRFVTEFGGKVEVFSRDCESFPKDHGTEFRVSLPLCLQEASLTS